MPSLPSMEARLNSASNCSSIAVQTVTILSNTFKTPFLLTISATTQSVAQLIKTVKQNKKDCVSLVEQANEVLAAIIALHIKSAFTLEELAPSILVHMGAFATTLHKIHTFLEEQQEGSLIRKIFHQGQIRTLLKNSQIGLQQAFDVFKIAQMNILGDIEIMERLAEERHQEVLALIAHADTMSSDTGSSLNRIVSSSLNSSISISLLPSEPKIFYGRDLELSHALKLLAEDAPRIAILGAGGMGKTSLAQVILHHSDIAHKYGEHRFFVGCDSAPSKIELMPLLEAYLGIKGGSNVEGQIIQHLSNGPPSLLILDNLETAWEPAASRSQIEGFLSRLADIQHLAIIITMRGAERPAEVPWTRPFLMPLQSLTQDAARRTFTDIADDIHDPRDMDRILALTDNMPLAIGLIAHLVDSEGCATVLTRWDKEKTSLVSDGYDQRTNLDVSISLSLSSPRLASQRGAKDLLSLLSILPDGLSDTELTQGCISINNILNCKTALLRTSLAYVSPQKKLKLLVPVREFLQTYYPPRRDLVEGLFETYEQLLGLFAKHGLTMSAEIVPRIASNFANIQGVITFRAENSTLNQIRTVESAVQLNRWSRHAGHGLLPLMEQIRKVLPQPVDHQLEACFLAEYLGSFKFQKIRDVDSLIEQALSHLPYLGDANLKCKVLTCAADIYFYQLDYVKAAEFFNKALSLASTAQDAQQQCNALMHLAHVELTLGNNSGGQEYAERAQEVSRLAANLYDEAVSLRLAAMCAINLGNFSRSIWQLRRVESLLNLCGMAGCPMDIIAKFHLIEVQILKSEYIQARESLKEILGILPVEEKFTMHALAHLNIADIDIATGEAAQDVQRNIDRSRKSYLIAGQKIDFVLLDSIQASLYLREGMISRASNLFEQCCSWGFQNSSEVATYCLDRLADNDRWGSVSSPSRWPTVYLAHALKTKQKRAIYRALQYLGDVARAEGAGSTAVALLTAALDGFMAMGIHQGRAECLLHLGDVAQNNGNVEKAEKLWRAAQPLFERSSQAKQVAAIGARLSAIKGVELG